ncbi:valine--tRNA ligase [Candidatus Schneideria nysicola]|uniref:valine--tRNA ligase n=1 Tax=Candidatus Schneideria nysicola TaxID=1081631 RepID=UPI001CAA76F2|nr:valine--tRNA ligase [Candidatus Schneideria nysicola]UAJ65308.1 valine--tRNA ligase [Candidatus Schneideria nysicola]
MDKIYNPQKIEKPLYEHWEKKGYFKPNNNPTKDNYCIMIPPPNITGGLHIGHAFQQTIMDILVRYHRMYGKNTLWQVGTDHAGIATQNIVEKKVFVEEGKTRFDYDRNHFIEKIWKWKKEINHIIKTQIRRLGNSVDWSRERFTMDEGFANAVKEVFVRLYQDGFIYRGKRLVNWDTKLCTAISDLEVENKEKMGSIWYLRYPLADNVKTMSGLNYITVATTRPETMLGDTGIIVHPKDSRYTNLIGKFVILPFVNRRIPILSDQDAKIEKGTGCVKITPAHDFNDYKIGQRHQLALINIMTIDGKIREKAIIFDCDGKKNHTLSNEIPLIFQGLDRFTAREKIIQQLSLLGLVQQVQPHVIMIPYGEKSGDIIEPMLTEQWFMRMQPLAKIAIEAVLQEKIQFIPKQYENMFFNWMDNIQDWCISRQLWWGHRIPAWYDKDKRCYVGRNEKEIRYRYGLKDTTLLFQDEDVLDTWFSSSLWTFVSLGWPNQTNTLRRFHPTDVIISGFDIIFFWIARMIMMTMYFNKDTHGNPQVPFKYVYITGLLRDEEGIKMSKTKGNTIDPIDIVDGISLKDLIAKRIKNLPDTIAEKIKKNTKKQFPNGIKPYGADAVRLTLSAIASTSRNINWDMNRLEGYYNFCNKLWHASRFVMMNTHNIDNVLDGKQQFSLADRWIIAKMNQTKKVFHDSIANYRFDLAVNILYEFTWNHFCDWYLEIAKIIFREEKHHLNAAELRGTRSTLIGILSDILHLAHPIIPFITDTIWKHLKTILLQNEDSIMLRSFPPHFKLDVDEDKVIIDFSLIIAIITTTRAVRTEMKIPASKQLTLFIRTDDKQYIDLAYENINIICKLSHINEIRFLSSKEKYPISAIAKIIGSAELIFPIKEIFNKEEELSRLEKELIFISHQIEYSLNKLNNKQFICYAPKAVIEKEKKKLENYKNIKNRLWNRKNIITS